MDEVLEQKLLTLKTETLRPVSGLWCIDLTTPAKHPRVSFPYPDHTPAEVAIAQNELSARLGYKIRDCDTQISFVQNVSSDPKGTCLVTKYAYRLHDTQLWYLSNTHAGSHADQPYHWLGDKTPFDAFDVRQYNGAAIVLNLSRHLMAETEPVITQDMLVSVMKDAGVESSRVRRLLLRTYQKTPKVWDKNFAYLDASASAYLAEFPRLVMLGTDAPSIDAEKASPIIDHAHGNLWKDRIAIIEGYNSDALPHAQRIAGHLRVSWNPQQIGRDAKGASISFYFMHSLPYA